MSDQATLPAADRPFVIFAGVLRSNGFAVAPEQTQNFIAAIGLLGPRTMDDIHRAATATFAPPPERRDEFDALFRLVFYGQSVAASAAEASEEDELQAFDTRDGGSEPPEAEEINEAGGEATEAEILSIRQFRGLGEDDALRRFRRLGPAVLPRRRSRRWGASKSGTTPDMRRALREVARLDGEVVDLPMLARRTRQRRILLLIDVSGSMKEQTEGSLRFAHTLAQTAERMEAFTIGTRLTRITRALRHRNREQALANVSGVVADWDGGTRLGDALAAFLAVPRFAGFARGALVVVISDGLERGDPGALQSAMERMSRLAWQVVWLTPLAADEPYIPQTEAMQAVAPHVDAFGSALGVTRICGTLLDYARRAA